MNFIQSPPVHYPSDQDSTIEVFRTRNFSLGGPPPYGAEREPPQYHEATEAERGDQKTAEGRARARKIRYIRILSSILIVTTVAMVVGAVVGKVGVLENKEDKSDDNDSDEMKKPAPTNFTVSDNDDDNEEASKPEESGIAVEMTSETPKAARDVYVRPNSILDEPIDLDYRVVKVAEEAIVDDFELDSD